MSPTSPVPVTPADRPCVHRGPRAGQARGQMLYRCALHGLCAIGKVRRDVAACCGCQDRDAGLWHSTQTHKLAGQQSTLWCDSTALDSPTSRGRGIGRVTRGLYAALLDLIPPARLTARPTAGPLLVTSPQEYAPERRGAPCFAYVHDLIPWHCGRGGDSYRAAMRRLRRYDALIANSDHTRRDFIATLGVDPGRIHVVGCGVESVFTARQSTERRGILNVGGADERKGWRQLIAAYAMLPGELRDEHRLTLAYRKTSHHRAQLSALARRHGVRIELVDAASDEQLAARYRSAAVMAFPSTSEGFGLPVVEAMACGCPVVAGDNTALPETGGEAAWYCDAADPAAIARAIAEALTSPERPTRIAAGLRHAAAFRWERVARRVAAIIRPILEGS